MRKNRRIPSWLPPAAWLGLIFLLSAVPGAYVPDLPVPFFHRLVHFVEYGVLGALFARSLFPPVPGKDPPVTLCLALILVLALSDEAHQLLVPGRGPDTGDVLFDTVFALIGVNLYAVLRFKRDFFV